MTTKFTLSLIAIFICQLTFSAVVTNITSGGAEYATVGAAVTAAVSGDTLLLSTGVFAENIDISSSKVLTFKGGYLFDFSATVPGEKAVIAGTSTAQSCIDVLSGSGLNLFDIELTNGGSASYGGGVDYHDGTTGVIVNCYIHHNLSKHAGGIYIRNNAYVIMTNTVVDFNYALVYGGGIAVEGGKLSVAQNCYIKDNMAVKMGGGIYAIDADIFMTGTNTYLGIFALWSGANNCTNGDGGGIYAANSDIVLSGAQCSAGYNFCSRDGAAFYITNSSLSLLDNSQIFAGWGTRNGGGIYAADSEIIMDDSAIAWCSATHGGGIFAVSCSGTFNKATIENNYANNNSGFGGGIFVMSTGSYIFTDSVFVDNKAYYGGGICAYLTAGDFILNNTDIISNKATSANGIGGGAYWFSLGTLNARNCLFNYNFSDGFVGGMYLPVSGKFLFNNTDISYNSASNHIGGIAVGPAGQLKCIDCSINNNRADANTNSIGTGGAIYSSGGTIDLISLNNTFSITNNSAADGGAAFLITKGQLSTYGDVLFENNRASQNGGAIYATNQCFVSFMPTNNASARIIDNFAQNNGGAVAMYEASEFIAVNPLFENNLSSNYGGGVYFYTSTGTVYAAFSGSNSVPPCTFIGNKALFGGGIYGFNASILISDSIFVSNSAFDATGKGGAVRGFGSSTINMVNSIVAHNNAFSGGGIGIAAAAFMQMKQCTVTENGIGGIAGGTLAITNSIIWDNDGVEITAGKVVDYCDVDGGYATGTGNIDVDPMFENAAALDYQPALGSPCVDTGTIVNVHNDCIGDTRPMGGGFDLGAYELNPAPLLKVVPLEVDFGDVVVGDNLDLPVSVENLGNSSLNGNIINLMVPIFSVQSGSPYTVTPLSSNVVTLRFSPIAETPFTNTVTFQSNGGNKNVVLIGTGIPEGGSELIIGMFILFFWEIKSKLSRL
ncbi:MAG: hypothetical protein DRI44_00860 [Chlamydiae bacterium]|nr:MAG: hypothetical protein DRI44_00860 [Chlamydiota bacterium]